MIALLTSNYNETLIKQRVVFLVRSSSRPIHIKVYITEYNCIGNAVNEDAELKPIFLLISFSMNSVSLLKSHMKALLNNERIKNVSN